MGEFHLRRGDLQNSLTCFGSTRDYNTTAFHSLEMCLNIVKVSLLTGNYVIAQQYINRGEELLRDPSIINSVATPGFFFLIFYLKKII